MTTIDIVIPSYNQAQFLPEAIDSAITQNFKRGIGVIVVDDGSKDGSLEIAQGYKEVKVISQVNKGLASARNTGVMNSQADYILFLDADDILLGNCIEEIWTTIYETNADIIAPSFKTFGTSNQEVILGNPTLEDFKTANRIGYCSAIKRSVLLEVGGYNAKMTKGWEDWDLWLDLLKRGKKLVTLPEVLWLYRTKESSMYTESMKYQDELMSQMKINHPEIW